jgi:uncharacterized protein DUF6049
MARRAARALPALFAFAASAPLVLLSGGTPAAASTAAASQPPATVTFTGLNPRLASPGTTVTMTGSVKNTAPVAQRLVVLLLDSSTPVSSVAELEQDASGALSPAGLPLPHATWTSGLLKPGTSASWAIQVPVSGMGLTSFGVYPIAAQVSNTRGEPLNNTLTYLPYVPARNGPYGSSIPAAQKISWVWPLIDQPLLDEPWQSACTGPQAAALAQSLASGGRLGQLVDAAGTTARTAAVQARAAQAGSSGAAQRLATLTEPGQSLAQDNAVTWAVDPALLVNVTDLSECGASEPQWARTASAWLAKFKETTASQPMFATAYGDPNVAALIDTGYAGDIENAFKFGGRRAGQIVGRSLTPPAAGTSPADPAGLAWLTGGPTSSVASELAGKDGIGTLLADSSAFPTAPTSVVRALNGIGGYVTVLLASDSLTSLLNSAGSGPGSALATAQQFLAETALLAQQHPSAPIIVAPPRRWQPPPGLASALLSATASAPWLSAATLTSLTGAARVPTVQLPAGGPGLSSLEQNQLSALDAAVARQQNLRAHQDPTLALAVSTIESSAYSGRQFKATALGMIEMLASWMARQEQKVHIVAENRITLGGTRGSVPVSIDNRGPFAVRVTLQLSYSQADGVAVSASPSGLTTVPAHTAETVRLRITAPQPGSTTITMTLLNQAGKPLASPSVRTTVQTTQVGLLGMIIFGAALGVFLLASAARAIRRGRPRLASGEAQRSAPREDDLPGHSTEEAGPDTVVTGTASWAPPDRRGRDRGD